MLPCVFLCVFRKMLMHFSFAEKKAKEKVKENSAVKNIYLKKAEKFVGVWVHPFISLSILPQLLAFPWFQICENSSTVSLKTSRLQCDL